MLALVCEVFWDPATVHQQCTCLSFLIQMRVEGCNYLDTKLALVKLFYLDFSVVREDTSY